MLKWKTEFLSENLNFWVKIRVFGKKRQNGVKTGLFWPYLDTTTKQMYTSTLFNYDIFFTYYFCWFVLRLVYYHLCIHYVSIKTCCMHLIRNKIRIYLFTKIDYSVSFFLVKLTRTQTITCFFLSIQWGLLLFLNSIRKTYFLSKFVVFLVLD